MTPIEIFIKKRRLKPGETIDATITWELDYSPKNSAGHEFEISLLWKTRGKGNSDAEVIQKRTFATNRSSGKKTLSFIAPTEPISFVGQLVSLHWYIEAKLKGDKKAVIKKIIISPTGSLIKLKALTAKA